MLAHLKMWEKREKWGRKTSPIIHSVAIFDLWIGLERLQIQSLYFVQPIRQTSLKCEVCKGNCYFRWLPTLRPQCCPGRMFDLTRAKHWEFPHKSYLSQFHIKSTTFSNAVALLFTCNCSIFWNLYPEMDPRCKVYMSLCNERQPQWWVSQCYTRDVTLAVSWRDWRRIRVVAREPQSGPRATHPLTAENPRLSLWGIYDIWGIYEGVSDRARATHPLSAENPRLNLSLPISIVTPCKRLSFLHKESNIRTKTSSHPYY